MSCDSTSIICQRPKLSMRKTTIRWSSRPIVLLWIDPSIMQVSYRPTCWFKTHLSPSLIYINYWSRVIKQIVPALCVPSGITLLDFLVAEWGHVTNFGQRAIKSNIYHFGSDHLIVHQNPTELPISLWKWLVLVKMIAA